MLTNLHFGILFTLFHSLHYTMLHIPAYGTYNVFTKLLFVWHGGRNYNKWHRGSLTDTYCWWWLTMLPIYKSQKIKTKQNCIASIDSLINNSHVDPKDYYSVHVVFNLKHRYAWISNPLELEDNRRLLFNCLLRGMSDYSNF